MRKRWVLALSLAIVTFVNALAAAPQGSVAIPSDAIRFGQSGVTNYGNEKWQEALTDFVAADAVMHSPVFALYIARCLKKLGRWKEAFAKYESVVSAPLSEEVPKSWQQAYEAAQVEQVELRRLIPQIRIRLLGNTSADVVVTVDGIRVSFENGGTTLTVDPGSHRIDVSLDGEPVETQVLDLSPSVNVRELNLGPYERESTKANLPERQTYPMRQTSTASRVSQVEQTKQAPENQRGLLSNIGTVALGVGFLGVAVGTASGIYAWRERRVISELCDDDVCPKRLSTRVERAETLADVSTVAFVAAAASFTAAGILFYVVPSRRTTNVSQPTRNSLEIGLIGRF